jgi:hypothetical protein
MQMTLTFPTRDGDLLAFLMNYSGKITASAATYGVSAADATELAGLVFSYETALLACDPTVRNQASVVTKNEARTAAKLFAYNLGVAIAVRPNVSAALKLELGIKSRRTPTRYGPPTLRAGVDVVTSANRSVDVRIHPSPTAIAGVASALVYTFVGATYPTDPTLWQFYAPVGRSDCRIDFPDTVAAGAQVWICAAYVSRRGETGPISVPVSTNLQVGGVNGASTGLKIAA